MATKILLSTFVILALVAFSSVSFAAAEEESGNAGTKLAIGLTNILTGWVELPMDIGKSVSTKDMGRSLVTEGIVKGLFDAIARTAAGVGDTVTFAFPPYNKPMMKPIDFSGNAE